MDPRKPTSLFNRWARGLAPVALAGSIFGCSSDESTTVELTVSDNSPEGSPPAAALDYWAEQVMEQTDGKLKLTVYHGGELLPGEDAFRGIKTGAADIGVYVVLEPDGFHLNTVMALPFMGWPDQEETMEVYEDLLEEFPEMKAEWDGVELVGAYMMPPGHLHTVDQEVRVPDDLDGIKTLVVDELAAEAAVAAGATPVELDIAAMGEAIGDGKVEAIVAHFPVMAIFGGLEQVNHHMIAGDGGINMQTLALIVNSDVADNLSDDVRDTLLNSGNIFTEKLLELDTPFIEATMAQAEEEGHTFSRLSDEEIQEWYDLSKQPVHDRWIAAAEADGAPGQEIYDSVLERLGTIQSK